MRHRRLATCLFLVAAIALSPGRVSLAAGPETDPAVDALIARARASREREDGSRATTLAAADRAVTYEAVDRLLNEGDDSDLQLAAWLARGYARAFSDDHLVVRAARFSEWDGAQRERRARAMATKAAARQALAEGRLDEADEAYERLLVTFRELGDRREEARSLAGLGAIEAMKGMSLKALQRLEDARVAAEQAGDRNLLCVVDLNRSFALDDLGRLDDALDAQTRALAIARETHDTEAEPRILINRASILLRLGRTAEARAAYVEVAASGARQNDAEVETNAWYNLGVLAQQTEDIDGQRESWEKALSIARRAGLKPSEADAELALGGLARRQGRWPESRRRLDAARAALQDSDDPQRLANLDYDEALYLAARGRFAETLPLLDAAERRYDGLDAAGYLGPFSASRSVALYYLGDYEGAVRSMRKAIELARQGGQPGEEAEHHAGLGYLLMTLGDSLGGMAEIEEAIRLHRWLGDTASLAYDLDEVGFVRYAAGDLEGAREALEESLSLLENDGDVIRRAETLKDLGLVELDSAPSRRPRGRSLIREARDAFSGVDDALGLLHASLIEAQAALEDGDATVADAALARALEAERPAGTREYSWLLRYLEGRRAELSGDPAGAERAYRQSIREVERRRAGMHTPTWRAAALEDRIAPYRQLTDLLLAQGRTDAAWLAARAGKARTFIENLRPPRLDSGTNEMEAVAASSEETGPAAPRSSSSWTARKMSTAAIRSLLRPREAMIDLYTDGGRIRVFILTDRGLLARDIPLDHDAARLIRSAGWPGRPDPADAEVTHAWRVAVRRIGAMVFDPLAADLAGTGSLLIVPGGALNGIPFAALESGGAPLMARYEITTLPAAETIVSRLRRGAGRGLLALGDPGAPGDSPLPASAGEVRAVASLSDGGTSFLGAAATEAAFSSRAPLAARIHLAAHGHVDPLSPSRSYLALAPGDGDDGRLEAAEIETLPIEASVVVLSGCATGVEGGLASQRAPGDERAGLPRAFLAAGAGTVIASLWEVDDDAARILLPDLYKGLAGRGAAGALLDLQRAARSGKISDASGRVLDHPYYWAGLSAFGAGFTDRPPATVPASR